MATYRLEIPKSIPVKREISIITIKNSMFCVDGWLTSNLRLAYEAAAKNGKEVVFK